MSIILLAALTHYSEPSWRGGLASALLADEQPKRLAFLAARPGIPASRYVDYLGKQLVDGNP